MNGSINELLQIMLENIHDHLDTGLCSMLTNLYLRKIITYEEFRMLRGYLENNLPSESYKYSWPRGRKRPRIKWLKEQIKLTQP